MVRQQWRRKSSAASTNGRLAGKSEPTHPQYTDNIDGGVIWRLDMIGKLGVFPHNMANCSPLLVGELLFVVTSNGVDQRHVQFP